MFSDDSRSLEGERKEREGAGGKRGDTEGKLCKNLIMPPSEGLNKSLIISCLWVWAEIKQR